MEEELRLRLSEEGADAGRLAVLVAYLRSAILQLDVEAVRPLPAGEAPLGARGLDATSVNALLITLGQSAGSLLSVITAVRDWLRRGEGAGRTVRLEIGGDTLELSQASATDQEKLIDLFVRRHGPGEAAP